MSGTGSVQFDSNGDGIFGDNTKTLNAGTFTISAKDNVAETINQTATDGNSKTGTRAGVVVNAGAAVKLAFSVQPSSAAAVAAITPAVKVEVRDASDNLVSSPASITLAVGTNAGSGTLSGTKTVAAVGGVATFSDLSIDKAGTGYTLAATATGLTGATSSTFNVTAGTATKLAFTTQPGGASKGVALTTQPGVEIQDASGNRVTTATNTVTLAIKSGTGATGATLGGTVAVNAVNGVATFTTLSLDKSGVSYQLTASATTLTSADSATFTVSGAAKLAFTTQPGNATVGSPIPGPPTVTVQRDDGSTESTSTTAITLAIGTNPAGGTLSGTTPKSATAGVSSFSDLSLDKVGSGYTLAASSAGLIGVTSASFEVTAVAPIPTLSEWGRLLLALLLAALAVRTLRRQRLLHFWGRYEEALALVKRVLTLNPNFANGHFNLAACYAELGRLEEARAQVAKALRLNPNVSLEGARQSLPSKEPADLERFPDALRKAGLK